MKKELISSEPSEYFTSDENLRFKLAIGHLDSSLSVENEIFVWNNPNEARIDIDSGYRSAGRTWFKEDKSVVKWLNKYIEQNPNSTDMQPYSGKNIVIERLIDLTSSEVKYVRLSNQVKCAILNLQGIDMDVNILNTNICRGKSVVAPFTLHPDISHTLLVITSQTSLPNSRFYSEEDITLVGTHNIRFNHDAIVSTVACHELIHAEMENILIELGSSNYEHFEYSFLSIPLGFFNEGAATLAQESADINGLKQKVKEEIQKLPPILKKMYFSGDIIDVWSNQSYGGINDTVESLGLKMGDKDYLLHVCSRLIPAVVVLFCIENNISIKDIFESQVARYEKVKPKIAVAYQTSTDVFNFTPELWEYGYPPREIRSVIRAAYVAAYQKPFEIIGTILGKTTEEVASDILNWL